mgnify:FL=1
MNVRRDPRRRLSTVGGSPWAVMLRHGLIAGAAACLALVVAAAIISGGGAAASAATASAVVAVPFALSGLALWWASGLSAYAPPLVMLFAYLVLVLVGAMLMASVETPGWLRPHWLMAAAAVAVGAWLGGMATGLRRARMPIYDVAVPDGDSERT